LRRRIEPTLHLEVNGLLTRIGPALAALLVTATVAACGGGAQNGSGDSSTGGTAQTPAPGGGDAAGDSGGASEPDADAIRQTVSTYVRALLAGDGKTACRQFVASTRQEIVEAARKTAPSGSSPPSCPDVLRLTHESISPSMAKRMRSFSFSSVRSDGDTATAQIAGASTMTLTRVDGEWQIARVK
jgi:hypothetical protein